MSDILVTVIRLLFDQVVDTTDREEALLFCKEQIELSIVNIMETSLVRNYISFNFNTWQELSELIPVMESLSKSDAVRHFW